MKHLPMSSLREDVTLSAMSIQIVEVTMVVK